MINFKDPKDQAPSAFAVIGFALIIGSVLSLFLYKRSDPKALIEKYNKDGIALTQRSNKADTDFDNYSQLVDKYLWADKEDLVIPAALNLVSQAAAANQLKFVGFRPLKSTETDSLVQLPLQFTVDGSFARVASMLDTLQKSNSKLAVQQVQFASQEGETDIVSANVTVYGFLQKPAAKSSKAKKPATKPESGTKIQSSGATKESSGASNHAMGAKK